MKMNQKGNHHSKNKLSNLENQRRKKNNQNLLKIKYKKMTK